MSARRRPNRRSFIRLPNGTTRLARLTGEYWRSLAPVREYRLVQYADGEIEAFVTTERSLLARIEWQARWKRLDVLRVDRFRGDAL